MYETIKKMCDESGITVNKMCSDLGISASTISNLKGRPSQKGLSAESTAKIADYFNMSALDLIKKSRGD